MAEGTYEDELNRAELLGIEPPNKVDWEEADRVRRDSQLAEEMAEIDLQDEKINENTSKMGEITNILSVTQMRLNKFKKACGSLTNLLKIKVGDDTEADTSQTEDEQYSNTETDHLVSGATGGQSASKQDMQQKMSSGIDKLDSLLTKTENAQYSMAHQSKQMKSFMQK